MSVTLLLVVARRKVHYAIASISNSSSFVSKQGSSHYCAALLHDKRYHEIHACLTFFSNYLRFSFCKWAKAQKGSQSTLQCCHAQNTTRPDKDHTLQGMREVDLSCSADAAEHPRFHHRWCLLPIAPVSSAPACQICGPPESSVTKLVAPAWVKSKYMTLSFPQPNAPVQARG